MFKGFVRKEDVLNETIDRGLTGLYVNCPNNWQFLLAIYHFAQRTIRRKKTTLEQRREFIVAFRCFWRGTEAASNRQRGAVPRSMPDL